MSLISFRGAFRAVATLSLCLVFGLARAQEAGLPEADPPDRAARLSFLQGDVSLQPAGEAEWAAAIVNRPLTTGDKLWTDQGARAEVYVGEAAVRLDGNTGFSFLNVDDDTIQMRITAGVINVNVRALDGNDEIEIDTPNLALSLLRPGNYRVEVNDAGDTTIVKVSEGEAEASGGSQNVIVHAQESATFRGTDQLVARFDSLGAPDEFDSWSLERERRDDRVASSQTAQYVAPDVTGYQDLDDNGTWSSDAEYGNVWTPTHVAVDWSPYRYGRWVSVAPWGWTWIDDAPWGYAPFHYGRWAHVRERWCWVPGPRHVRAVYAPALVGWVGGGGVAWFPLGPREVYVPSHRYSRRYVERVNVSNTVIVNRSHLRNAYENRARNVTYRNRAVPGGVTAVSRATFTSAGRTGDRRVRVDERQFARADATAVAPQIQPGRESRLGAGEARRNVRVPPRTVENRQVVVKRNPPPSATRFTRDRDQNDAARAPRVDRNDAANRRPDITNNPNARPDATRDAAQVAARDRVRAERSVDNAQTVRGDRPVRVEPSADRPQRPDRSQVDELARRNQQSQGDRWKSPDRPQVEQLQRQQQERRQAELQQRQQQRDQAQQQGREQQERERAVRQRDQQQQAAAQQAEQRQRNTERQRTERSQPERQSRPEPRQPAENKPQPQPRQDRNEWRQERGAQKH